MPLISQLRNSHDQFQHRHPAHHHLFLPEVLEHHKPTLFICYTVSRLSRDDPESQAAKIKEHRPRACTLGRSDSMVHPSFPPFFPPSQMNSPRLSRLLTSGCDTNWNAERHTFICKCREASMQLLRFPMELSLPTVLSYGDADLTDYFRKRRLKKEPRKPTPKRQEKCKKRQREKDQGFYTICYY